MKEEKLVIFDWGGVIESHREGEYSFHRAIENIIRRLSDHKISGDIISIWEDCVYIENGNKISETSNMEDIKFWFHNIKNRFNLNCTFEKFIEVYKEEFMKVQYYNDVVEYAHSLKDRCKIGILSNLAYLDKERIDYQVDLSKFNYVWLSFELNCIKPNEKIYNSVENYIDIDNENILFIDDTFCNLEIPKQHGWHTCQAFGYELDKIKESVDAFLNE